MIRPTARPVRGPGTPGLLGNLSNSWSLAIGGRAEYQACSSDDLDAREEEVIRVRRAKGDKQRTVGFHVPRLTARCP